MSKAINEADDILWESIYNGLKFNNFLTLEEYNQRCTEGYLSKYKFPIDDQDFHQANPYNPMSSGNRFPRIKAGDDFRQFVVNGNGKAYLSDQMIDFLNEHLFDCCASVRQSLIVGLNLIGNEKSFDCFENLAKIEESASNKMMLELAIQDRRIGRK